MKANKERDYDEQRKRESKKNLLRAINALAEKAEHKTKPISNNELSKRTGIARTTIDRFPEVLERLEEVNARITQREAATLADVNTDNIQSLDEAKVLIETMTSLFNEQEKKLQEAKKIITQRDSEIARLMDEKNELKKYVESKNNA